MIQDHHVLLFVFQIRESALKVLDELHKRLGEDYMPLLPDTVPFLAELMEGRNYSIQMYEYLCPLGLAE